jgi:hypothetical protein
LVLQMLVTCLHILLSPRNGRRISALQLIRAMNEVYHVSIPLGTLLSLVGVFYCGNGLWVNLEDLARHNKIEHDASLTHQNCPSGSLYAPSKPDQMLIDQFLVAGQSQTSDHLTLADLVSYRAARDATLSSPLSSLHRAITYGEIAFTVELFADKDLRVPKTSIQQWFAEERLPEGFSRPKNALGFTCTTKYNIQIQKDTQALEAKQAKERA